MVKEIGSASIPPKAGSQFYEFSKLLDEKRDGSTITVWRLDFWLRQAKLMDDRKVTMTDTGILFFKLDKTELTFDECMEVLEGLCEAKELDVLLVKERLENCGRPGAIPVVIPEYRDYFRDYIPQNARKAKTKQVYQEMEDEQATIESQYYEFSKHLDGKRSGQTITIYRSDFWMRQAKILDDRKVTMTDTGVLFFRWQKTELEYDEWLQFLEELCTLKCLDLDFVKETLTNCGIPGQTPVVVPQYRDFFLTYKPREIGINLK